MADDKIICKCHSISKIDIINAIRNKNADSVNKAGIVLDVKFSCDKCREKIKKLIKKNC